MWNMVQQMILNEVVKEKVLKFLCKNLFLMYAEKKRAGRSGSVKLLFLHSPATQPEYDRVSGFIRIPDQNIIG